MTWLADVPGSARIVARLCSTHSPVVLLVLALGVLSHGSAAATVMVEVPLEDMVSDADSVIHGVVTRSGVQMIKREGSLDPHTVTRVRVTEALKGRARVGDEIIIRELGGTFLGGGTWIDGTPRYAAGDEVIVFLAKHREVDAHFRTYAMVQGKFVVRRGVPGVPAYVTRDTSAVSFAKWSEGGMEVVAGATEPAVELSVFIDFIRRIARTTAQSSTAPSGTAPRTRAGSGGPLGGAR